MNSTSTQKHEKLVLSRKLNPSEKQRRKQLIAEANKSAKKLTDNNFLLKRKTNFTGQTAESFSCLGRNSDANINARPGKDQVDHSKKSSQHGKKPSIDLIDTGKHNNIGRIRNQNYQKKVGQKIILSFTCSSLACQNKD